MNGSPPFVGGRGEDSTLRQPYGGRQRSKHLRTIPEHMDRALAEHEKAQAYPEAAEQARAEFAELHSGTG